MTTPREDFLISMFQDDPRLVEALREEDKKFNWLGAIIAFGVSSLFWTGIILAWLYRKGWL